MPRRRHHRQEAEFDAVFFEDDANRVVTRPRLNRGKRNSPPATNFAGVLLITIRLGSASSYGAF